MTEQEKRIEALTTKEDGSPTLKRGEVKQILIQTANELLPDFKFLDYKSSSYNFQRTRQVNGWTKYELLYIGFSLAGRSFSCSIASVINPELIHLNAYNIGLINPHTDLKVLKHNTGALGIDEAYYFHNGHVATTMQTVRELFQDYITYGLPFLDKQLVRLQTNEIVKAGLDYIGKLKMDKESLKNEFEQIRGSFDKHPLHIDLKKSMQAVPRQSREDRQLIPYITTELLEMYWENEQIPPTQRNL